MKYKKLWKDFFKEQIKQMFDVDEEIEIVSVEREEDAKVDEAGWKDITGGRVDLLIRTKNSYIIIENKIDSSIIENAVNGKNIKNITQLERYYNYVEYLKYDEADKVHEEVVKLTKEIKKYSEKYQNPDRVPKRSKERWVKLSATKNSLQAKISEINKRKIFGFVLSPNYNQPEDNLLEIKVRPNLDNVDWYEINNNIPRFKWLSYRTMYDWLSMNAKTFLEQGETYDANFKAFYDAMKKHTYDYENLALFEDMKNTFFARIKEFKNSHNTKENA
jgi:hypothetical protein